MTEEPKIHFKTMEQLWQENTGPLCCSNCGKVLDRFQDDTKWSWSESTGARCPNCQ